MLDNIYDNFVWWLLGVAAVAALLLIYGILIRETAAGDRAGASERPHE